MISIAENRTLILEKNGEWVLYQKEIGFLHQANLDDYAHKKHL